MDSNTIYDEADGQSYGWLSDHLFAPTPDRFNTDLDTTDFGEYQFPTFDAAYCNKFPNFVDIRDKQYTSGPPSAFTVSSATGTDVSSIDPSVLSYSASSEDQNIADIGLAWFNLKPTPDTINSVHGMQATDNSFPENEPPTTLDPSNMFLNISVPSAISPPLALMDLISVPAVSNKAVHRANSTLKHIANKKNLKNRYSCPECSLCFDRFSNRKQHMQIHKSPSEKVLFKCTECDTSFSRKSDLKRHESSSRHTGKKSEAQWTGCDDCGKGWVKGSQSKCSCCPG